MRGEVCGEKDVPFRYLLFLFQGNQENNVAHAPCFPSQSQPRMKAFNLTCTEVFLVIVKHWGACSKAARPGSCLSTETHLERQSRGEHHSSWSKQLNLSWQLLRLFNSPERSILAGFLSSLNPSDRVLREQRQL